MQTKRLMACAVWGIASILPARDIQWITPIDTDFGSVLQGTVLDGEIKILNTGKGRLKISDVSTSCGCTVAKIDKKDFAPGDTAVISYKLNTDHFDGVVRKTITVHFEKASPKSQVFSLTARVHTEIDIQPRYIVLRQVEAARDTVINRTVVIRNYSKEKIRIKKIEAPENIVEVRPKSKSISAGDSVKLDVRIRPKGGTRKWHQVRMITDCKSKPELRFSVYMDIKKNES
ncbi:DUF1573 domain-containing protein [bacterium]|nr:DUF1573 domain-containing protein [bacterium]